MNAFASEECETVSSISNDSPSPEVNFGDVRKAALEHWIEKSSRKRNPEDADDDINDSVFCALQCRVTELYGDTSHLALFCTLGDWGSHITDMLFDESSDIANMNDENYARRLFRFYSRLMFIVQELYDDWTKILAIAKKDSDNSFNPSDYNIVNGENLSKFVNNIVKHKKANNHCFDHHNPIVFEDGGNNSNNTDITIANRQFSPASCGQRYFVLSLKKIIDIALECEQKLAKMLEPEDRFKKIYTEFKGTELPDANNSSGSAL